MSKLGKYTITTERIGGNGTTYSQEFQCKTYDVEDGVIDFYNENNEHWFIPIYKFDYVHIKPNPVVEPNGF